MAVGHEEFPALCSTISAIALRRLRCTRFTAEAIGHTLIAVALDREKRGKQPLSEWQLYRRARRIIIRRLNREKRHVSVDTHHFLIIFHHSHEAVEARDELECVWARLTEFEQVVVTCLVENDGNCRETSLDLGISTKTLSKVVGEMRRRLLETA